MADTVPTDTSNQGGEGATGAAAAAATSAASSPLTPQQRDEQTIAAAFGSPAAIAAEAAATSEAPPPGEGSAADGDADAGSASSGDQDGDGGDTAATAAVAATGDIDSLTDEQIDSLITALADIDESRLLGSQALRERLQKRIDAEVQQRDTERQRTATLQQENSLLIAAGRKSAQAVVDALTRARQELEKANKGEEFDLDAVKPNEVVQHFQSYGAAVAQVIRQGYDNAYSTAFTTTLNELGDGLTKEEQQSIGKIAARAGEILADQRPETGGQDKANTHFFTETMKVLLSKARAAGRKEAEAESQKKKDAVKSIVDSNLLPAAAAKAAKARAAMPPKPTDAAPESPANAPTMEAYRAAKQSGNRELADEIMAQMMMSSGQRTTGR